MMPAKRPVDIAPLRASESVNAATANVKLHPEYAIPKQTAPLKTKSAN